jgi:hypothetical protein
LRCPTREHKTTGGAGGATMVRARACTRSAPAAGKATVVQSPVNSARQPRNSASSAATRHTARAVIAAATADGRPPRYQLTSPRSVGEGVAADMSRAPMATHDTQPAMSSATSRPIR